MPSDSWIKYFTGKWERAPFTPAKPSLWTLFGLKEFCPIPTGAQKWCLLGLERQSEVKGAKAAHRRKKITIFQTGVNSGMCVYKLWNSRVRPPWNLFWFLSVLVLEALFIGWVPLDKWEGKGRPGQARSEAGPLCWQAFPQAASGPVNWSSLLQGSHYNTSPPAVCSCVPSSSSQLAFQIEMASL